MITRAKRMAAINDANNVYTREYAIQLHGMSKKCTPSELKEHVEKVLVSHGKLPEKEAKVWDVALITNCAGVLKQAVKQAPLERKFAIIEKRLAVTELFKEEKVGHTRDGSPPSHLMGGHHDPANLMGAHHDPALPFSRASQDTGWDTGWDTG